MIELKNVTKKFGGLTATDEISFKMKDKEILGLIGPNGSGKTTIFNQITGFLDPTSGTISFQDEKISGLSPDLISKKGIVRTFQMTSVLSELTVEENILYGMHNKINISFLNAIIRSRKYKEQEDYAIKRVKEILKTIRLSDKSKSLAKNIPTADQRKLMIGIALAAEPKVLLLDEPAAGTTSEEQEELLEIIRVIAKSGTSILIIEHHMDLIMKLCDRIIALNFGKKIAEGTPDEIQNDPDVIEAYLGRKEDVS